MWTLFWIIITFCATATIVQRIDMRGIELQLTLDGIIDRLNKLENK